MAVAHISVMLQEAMSLLKPGARKKYLDGTLGGGGHAEKILIQSSPDGQLLGLDWDEEAIMVARERLGRFGDRVIIRRANFSEAKNILMEIGWHAVDGILLDLGLSSYHLESAERGFSFQTTARLDMRMDRRQALDAHRIVNTFPVSEMERIIRNYGEEPRARRIAFAIEARRKARAIDSAKDLAGIVVGAKGRGARGHHPATQTFQALRIAVNRELENLDGFLENAYELLQPGGRLAVISFHSLEDRRVKQALRKWSRDCLCPPKAPTCRCGWSRKAKLLTLKPLNPSREEIEANPRARSAKLRAVERI